MAALGRWETGWNEEVKAAMLFGTESFVKKRPLAADAGKAVKR